MPVLEDLWVFTDHGTPVIDFSKKGSVDKSLLGCAISAIELFSQKVSGKKIKAFNEGNNKFSCIPCLDEKIILVIKSSSDTNDKTVRKIGKIISKIFEKMFTIGDIEKWNGDLSFFDEFKSKLDLYFRMGDL